MAWTGMVLTVDGQNALNKAQVSNKMSVKSIVVGDGGAPADSRALSALVHQLYEITDLKVEVEGGRCTLTADIPHMGYDYYFREIGVIVVTDEGEKLYVYDNCGDGAQHIVSTTGVEKTRKRIRLVLNISDVAEITVVDSGILYVSYEDFEQATEELRGILDKKVSMEEGKDLSSNDFTDTLKDKLLGMEDGANRYVHPETHPAEMIAQDPYRRFVSDTEKAAWDGTYQQATGYTDTKIADLINGAPSTLDTLGEIAQAMQDNADVVDALEAAIGKKANAAEFDSHVKDSSHITAAERTAWNGKADKTSMTGATASAAGTSGLVPAPAKGGQASYLTGAGTWQNMDDHAAAFTSEDVADGGATAWTSVAKLASGEKHGSIFNKLSNMFKNIRYLYKMLGTTDISAIGDGTVTGALSSLNTGLDLENIARYEIRGKKIPPNNTINIKLPRDKAIYLLSVANPYNHGIVYIIQTGSNALGNQMTTNPLRADNYFTFKNLAATSFDLVAGNADGYLSAILLNYYV